MSNGKKLLASALLTKGVKVKEDATFAEFAKAIQRIPQQMVLDSGETAAEIVYEYHYHKNGKGKTVNASLVSAADRGGCYNTPVYHYHTDACYTEVSEYKYTTKESVTNKGWVRNEHDGTPNNRYYCDHCGKEFVSNSARHYEWSTSIDVVKSRKGRIEDIIQTKVLACGKEDGQIEGYCVSCGFAHGQVAAAHLKFQGKNAKYNTKVAAINTSNAVSTASLRSTRSLNMLSLVGTDFGSGNDENASKENIDEAASGVSAAIIGSSEDIDQNQNRIAAGEISAAGTSASDDNNSQKPNGTDADETADNNENNGNNDNTDSSPNASEDTGTQNSTAASDGSTISDSTEKADDSSSSGGDTSETGESSGEDKDDKSEGASADNDEADHESADD